MAPSTWDHRGLRAHELTIGYAHTAPVTRDLSVSVPSGAFTAIVGPNACGKSTFLRALARVLSPHQGSVLLDEQPINSYAPKKFATLVGLLPQHPVAPDGITVVELVARGRYPHQSMFRQWQHQDDVAVLQAMRHTNTVDLADRPVESLSGGQRQRVWIAMALAQETEILLLDEPTSFLDMAHQVEVMDLCLHLNLTKQITVVAVLHDLNQAARYADHIIAMKRGEVEAEGPPDVVITPELVERVFGLEAQVISDPVTRTPLVVPGRHPRTGPHGSPVKLTRSGGNSEVPQGFHA